MERLWNNITAVIAIILAIGLVAAVFAKPEVVTLGNSESLRTLDVSGDGTASADPNVADVFVTVQTKADTAAKAQDDNAARVNSLTLALQGSGLVTEVTTTSFNVYPDFIYDPETGESRAIGYIVTHSLKAHTNKVNGVGKILDIATANGATSIDYVQFSLSDDKVDALKKQALTKATVKAADKAKTLALASGVTLGKPARVSETSFFQPPVFFGAERFAAAGAQAVPTQVIPGQIEVSATVSISYEIT